MLLLDGKEVHRVVYCPLNSLSLHEHLLKLDRLKSLGQITHYETKTILNLFVCVVALPSLSPQT